MRRAFRGAGAALERPAACGRGSGVAVLGVAPPAPPALPRGAGVAAWEGRAQFTREHRHAEANQPPRLDPRAA